MINYCLLFSFLILCYRITDIGLIAAIPLDTIWILPLISLILRLISVLIMFADAPTGHGPPNFSPEKRLKKEIWPLPAKVPGRISIKNTEEETKNLICLSYLSFTGHY